MSIKAKLTIMFLAIASIPLLFVSALTFTNSRTSLEAAHISNLSDITAFKADKIETYVANLKAGMKVAQSGYVTKRDLPIFSRLAFEQNNPEFIAAKKQVDVPAQEMQKALGLEDIMHVNRDGKVVYSSNPQHYTKDFLKPLPDPGQQAFEQGKRSIYLSDVFLDAEKNHMPAMLITAPVTDLNGIFVGVVAFEVDMSPVYKIIGDNTRLGKTGESVMARKVGNEVLYLSPLKYDPNAAKLNKKIPLGAKVAVPIQNAVQGKTGAAIAIDYRGRGVIGAWKYMPSLDWGLATKIDTSEAFADVTNLRNLAFIILIIVLALSGIIAFSIAKSISEPIQRLSEGAAIIGSGNLDYKVGTNLKDEIGQLSRAFDQMTHDLKTTTASRDELNREIIERKRTEEELRRQRELLAVTLASIGDAVIVSDTGGRVTFINGEAERLTGWTNQEASGQLLVSVFNIINEQTRQPVESPVDKVLRLGVVVGLANHTLLIAKDGRQIPIDDSGAPIRQQDGTVHGVVLVFRDFTEQKQAENEVKRHVEELLRLNNAMGGRELRMIELKKEVNDLCDRLGQQKRYSIDFDKEQP